MSSTSYSLVELARLAGVTERTLRYYDQIGLLKPRGRSAGGARRYGRDELLRLQQILLYRTLGYSLEHIGAILDDPSFDLLESLLRQREKLQAEQQHMEQLVGLIDKTIEAMNDKSKPLSDRDLYEGLSQEKIDAYRTEAEQRWGDEFQNSEEHIRQMSKAEVQALKREGEQIVGKLAQMMRLTPEDATVQKTVSEYYNHLNKWNATDKERFRALADMYVEDDRFRAYYDKRAQGLAEWLREAIRKFTATS